MRIKTLAIFSDGIGLDENPVLTWDWFNFDSYDVVQFNKTDDGLTTIWLDGGLSIKIAIKYDDYSEIAENKYQLIVDPKIKYEFEDK